MSLPEDLCTKILNKELGITAISPDPEYSGEDEKDKPYKFSTGFLTVTEEIVKLMELYEIPLVEAITAGVKTIAKSKLDNILTTTLED